MRRKPPPAPSGAPAELLPIGTRVEWSEPPLLTPSPAAPDHPVPAASRSGVVSMLVSGWALVRFDLPGGERSQPLAVVRGQPTVERSA